MGASGGKGDGKGGGCGNPRGKAGGGGKAEKISADGYGKGAGPESGLDCWAAAMESQGREI